MSKKIGLFYGTTTGTTESIAETIQQMFGNDVVELHDISQADTEDFDKYEYIIIGCSTWNQGDMQSDWESFFEQLDEIDFSGKKIAYFGPGDQNGYPYSFQDAMGMLEEKISSLEGQTVGYTSIDGYDFQESKALRNNKFCGLAIDEDNQSELTQQRVQAWVTQLKQEFSL
ncbi:MAG: flavodoxin FldA [Calothrix sp. C42_A2020_038]|nr:flavodoxin FldA [Calothrix sp. C42_A2020_038]